MAPSSKDLLLWSTAAVVGFGLAWGFGVLTCDVCPPATEPETPTLIACYDAATIGAMVASEAKGIRFYLARPASGAEFTVLGGPYKEDGSHVPETGDDLTFRMFKGISGTATDMELLKVDEAIAAAKAASSGAKHGWSVELTEESIHALLGVSGAMGIGLFERNTTEDDWTFDIVPVLFKSGKAEIVGRIADMRVGAPCPMHCPRDPSFYLHLD